MQTERNALSTFLFKNVSNVFCINDYVRCNSCAHVSTQGSFDQYVGNRTTICAFGVSAIPCAVISYEENRARFLSLAQQGLNQWLRPCSTINRKPALTLSYV